MTADNAQPDSSSGLDGSQEGSLSYLVRICFVATLGGLLFGYDTAVIAGAIGFLKVHFGLTPVHEGWTAASALAGCMVGAGLAGVLSDRLGRKRVLILCALLFVISAIGTALPRTQFVFVIFRAIGGVGVGAASMTSPMYISEISPARIRGRMVSLNQLAIVAGMAVSLALLGFAAYFGRTDVWILVFILSYIACFALSVGPVTWVILAEIFPTCIRGRAMAIATICLWASNLVVSQTFPMLDKDPWLVETFHHGFPFWIYSALSVVAIIFVAVFVPETKGRTLEEIERGWLKERA